MGIRRSRIIFALFSFFLTVVIAFEAPIPNPTVNTINFVRYCALNTCSPVSNYPARIRTSGRVTTAACANINSSRLRNHPRRTGNTQRNFVRSIGLPTDFAGHIFARRFDAPPDLWNMFPVNSRTNNSPMKSAESQIARIVGANGTLGTEICVRFMYNTGSLRPAIIYMSAKTSTSTTVWQFSN